MPLLALSSQVKTWNHRPPAPLKENKALDMFCYFHFQRQVKNIILKPGATTHADISGFIVEGYYDGDFF
jgi:hypothetical protein